MLNSVQFRYLMQVSHRFERFSIKSHSPLKVQARCLFCGDSQKSKSKARGWLLEKNNRIYYYCHNCGISYKFEEFLEKIDVKVYNDYIIDVKLNYIKRTKPVETKKDVSKVTKEFDTSIFNGLKKVSQLSPTHPAKQYIVGRKIPSKFHYKIYYTTQFKHWVNNLQDGKFANTTDINDSPRLVFPFLGRDKKVIGFCGRSLSKRDSLRYISIMLIENEAKVFGLDTVDLNKKFYIVEGPVDSLFLNNSIAMAGADLSTDEFRKGIYVLDNESRNSQIVNRIEKLLNKGRKVCIWPKSNPHNDINDMILAGYSTSQIEDEIDSNVYSGLQGILKLNSWKDC